jgi:phage terminase large subunit-like protein
MSLTRDMTGAVLIVPEARNDYDGSPEHEEAKVYYQFPLLWITRAAVDKWSHEVDYFRWANDGYLKIIEAQRIDFKQVRSDIVAEFGATDVQCLTCAAATS